MTRMRVNIPHERPGPTSEQMRRARRVAEREADEAAIELRRFSASVERYRRGQAHEQDQPAALSRRLESARALLYGERDESLAQRVEDAEQALGITRKRS